MQFYSPGKLLLSAEYAVLEGAKALALPCKYGQSLMVQKSAEKSLIWESYTLDNKRWLQVEFDLPRLRIINATFDSKSDGGNDSIAERLQNILLKIQKQKSDLFQQGLWFKSSLAFDRNWGLGTSSTLINNLAQWAKINAYDLQFSTFGGSGYDIACAQASGPILYTLSNGKPVVQKIDFRPNFSQNLYFVYLNRKQNSRKAIAQYKKRNDDGTTYNKEISDLSIEMINAKVLTDFEKVLKAHENFIASIIGLEPIQTKLFGDYFGQTKSLGAWGGDFILATGDHRTPAYFKAKGYDTILTYEDLIL